MQATLLPTPSPHTPTARSFVYLSLSHPFYLIISLCRNSQGNRINKEGRKSHHKRTFFCFTSTRVCVCIKKIHIISPTFYLATFQHCVRQWSTHKIIKVNSQRFDFSAHCCFRNWGEKLPQRSELCVPQIIFWHILEQSVRTCWVAFGHTWWLQRRNIVEMPPRIVFNFFIANMGWQILCILN